MALAKAAAVDKVIVSGRYNFITVRTRTVITEDDVMIAERFSSVLLKPGVLNDAKDALVETTLTSYSAEIQGIAAAVWTDAVKAQYLTDLKAGIRP